MDHLNIWPHLADLCALTRGRSTLELWLFGSAVQSQEANDIDVLFIYTDRRDVVAVREAQWWHHKQPPISIIAMTMNEEREYEFCAQTGAVRLV